MLAGVYGEEDAVVDVERGGADSRADCEDPTSAFVA